MARITVEDCIDKFPSRFELVLVASNRARRLFSGENPTVEKDNDKHTVIALREIASQTITSEQLKNDLIEEYQTVTVSDEDNLNELNQDNDEEENNSDQLLENQKNVEDNSSENDVKDVLEDQSSDETSELSISESQAEEKLSETE